MYNIVTNYWERGGQNEIDLIAVNDADRRLVFFLLPDMERCPDVEHSYIVELKYLKTDATPQEAESQWQEAVGQIRQYGEGERVRVLKRHTQLHLIVVQLRGYDIERMEEIGQLTEQ